MPKSRRVREVALTQTDKRSTRDHKKKYIQEVRDAVDNHETIYLFSYENMRSNKFKNVRMHFRSSPSVGQSSRIFLGKNKLLQIALGRTPEEEYADNLRHVSKQIAGGNVGLLFTSCSHEEVETYFRTLVEADFARAGFKSDRVVTLSNEKLSSFPVSMVEQFRKLGLPVKVDNGKLVLLDEQTDFRICKEGEVLSAEKCKLLVQFGIKLASFRIQLECRWSNNEFELLS